MSMLDADFDPVGPPVPPITVAESRLNMQYITEKVLP